MKQSPSLAEIRKGPLRLIIDWESISFLNNLGHGAFTARLHLECGHTMRMKGSDMPKHRTRCAYCRADYAMVEQKV